MSSNIVLTIVSIAIYTYVLICIEKIGGGWSSLADQITPIIMQHFYPDRIAIYNAAPHICAPGFPVLPDYSEAKATAQILATEIYLFPVFLIFAVLKQLCHKRDCDKLQINNQN
ncbi:MAG: hypothetical protein K2W82_12645 [Candidatus Obscuribacterales bacterium]|nr:hypothetical protein [Candidatus Obscuribacterales bacterium]